MKRIYTSYIILKKIVFSLIQTDNIHCPRSAIKKEGNTQEKELMLFQEAMRRRSSDNLTAILVCLSNLRKNRIRSTSQISDNQLHLFSKYSQRDITLIPTILNRKIYKIIAFMIHNISPRASLNLLQNHSKHPQTFTSRKVILTQYTDQSHSRPLSHIRSNHTLLQLTTQFPPAHSKKYIQQHKQYYNLSRRNREVPPQIQAQKQTQHMRGLLSPTRITSINRRINFTYKKSDNSNNQNSLNTYTSSPSLHNLQSRMKIQLQKKKEKRIKNQLCSKQFSISYTPTQSSYMKYSMNKKKISFVQQFQRSSNLLSHSNQKDSSIKTIEQSKSISTTATQSIYIQNPSTNLLTQSMNNRQNSSQLSFFKAASNKSLLQKIPSSKQLGKTVIIPNYSFGGVIQQDNSFKAFCSQQIEKKNEYFKSNKCLPRQWNNQVKGLINSQCFQQLKHSIHCGPQIRLEHHKFDLLNGWGRQIQESSLSFVNQ